MKLLKIDIDNETDTSNVTLPKEYLDGLKKMFKTLVEFLSEHNIDYFIDGGTLLGCVREHGQIVWDDDIDIGMDPQNYNKFRKLLQEFSKNKYRIIDYPHNIIKISDINNAYIRTTTDKDLEPRYACIDIFQYILHKQYYVIENKKTRKAFIEAKYHKNDLFPLKEYEYEDIKVKGANNPYPYLNNYYGDWKKRCVHIYT